ARITRAIQRLKHVGDAFLRVVEFVAERRETGNRYEAQTEVPWIARKLWQTDLLVDAGSAVLLKYCGGNPAEGKPRPVDQRRREDVGLADHQVLGSARNLIAETRNGGEAWTGKRLEKVPVGKAIPHCQLR